MNEFFVDKTDFNPTHTFECGQFFRYKKVDNAYFVVSGAERMKIVENAKNYHIFCTNNDYFCNFLDLKTDYSKIKSQIKQFDFMKNKVDFAYGIRILKQPLFEVVVDFVISQNNNIKRIQKIIEAICEKCGKRCTDDFGEYFAFPTQTQMLALNEQDYIELGLGYRAKYMHQIVPLLTPQFLDDLRKMPTETARKTLIALPGIGHKVADCILLFGLGRGEVFPVDVWCEKVYLKYFASSELRLTNREQISNYLSNKFGAFSGLVQQYLFYSEREKLDS